MATANISTAQPTSKGWNITLWVLQIIMGLAFLAIGGMKLVTSDTDMIKNMHGDDSMLGWVRFAGVAEVLGGLGLILPSALRIQPKLTVWAAIGLLVIMVLAVGLHVQQGEADHALGIIPFFVLLSIIAYGRSAKAPIQAK